MQRKTSWWKLGASVLAASVLTVAGLGTAAAQKADAKKAPVKTSAKKAPVKKAPAKPASTAAKAGGAAAGAATAGALAARSGPIELQVWHALNGEQAQEFQTLVTRFNEQQHGFTVKVSAEPSQETLISNSIAAIRAKRPPHLIEIRDNHAPEFVAQQGAILPLYELLAKYPIKDLHWFLPQTTSTVRDTKGRLLALPWMAEAPIYVYNRDLYQRAGLNPDAPPRTWREMQGHLLALLQSGVSCPYATSWQSWIHVENLAAMHNIAYATRNNGLDGPNGAALLANNLLHVRHMALMMSWVRSNLFPVRSEHDEADEQFVNGQCGVLTTGSGVLTKLQAKRNFSYGVAPLPYYDEEAKSPSNPFVGGASFWALGGHSVAEQKALATFIAYLATPVVATEWHQKTGFLPLTEAAWRTSDVSFYKSIPGADGVVRSMAGKQSQFTRGFRLNNYTQVSGILNDELEAIWSGRKAPKQGLDDAVQRASLAMRSKK